MIGKKENHKFLYKFPFSTDIIKKISLGKLSLLTNVYFMFTLYFVLIFVILLSCNTSLFTNSIFEIGDTAANSILINQAKNFDLLVGNYSHIMFNHPGPGLLYIQAFFEVLLCDFFHIVPTPFNAHMISILFLNSVLLSLAACIFYKYYNSHAVTLLMIAVILMYCALNQDHILSSTWMPHVYFTPFLVFLISCASLASSNASNLWIIALTGCLLVHGHASFIVFIIPITVVAFVLALQHYKFNVYLFFKDNESRLTVFGIILLIFLLPIVFNTVMNYPGEIGKYIEYVKSEAVDHPTFGDAFYYIFNFYTSDPNNGILLAIFLMISSVICIFIEEKGNKRSFLLNIILFNIIATISFLCYIFTGMDHLHHYMGIFYGSVPLLFMIIVAITIYKFMKKGIVSRSILIVISISIVLLSLNTGNFTNNNVGAPYMQYLTNTIETSANDRKILLHIQDRDSWPWVTGLVVALERKSVDVFLDNPWWGFMFTQKHIFSPDIFQENYQYLTVKRGAANGPGVIFSNNDISVVESKYNSSYSIGNIIDFSINGNSKSYTVSGWSDSEDWGTWTNGPRARLMFFIKDVNINEDKVLIVKAHPFINEVNHKLYVDIYANRVKVGQLIFSKRDKMQQRILIPGNLIMKNGALFILFEVHNPVSPSSLGLSKDTRIIGLGIHELTIVNNSNDISQ